MSKTVTLRLDDDLFSQLQQLAKIDNRTVSNFIETATLRYIEESELADDLEMEDIRRNSGLVKRLKEGSRDARKKRGKLVG